MRVAVLATLSGLTLWCGVALSRQEFRDAPASSTTSQPAILRQNTFNIPFSAAHVAGGITQVELYVSTDRGQSWKLAGGQRRPAGQFQFRAPSDGHYWFASRVIDAQGQAITLEQLRAMLHVVVDTAQPKMQFNAVAGDSGDVMSVWSITDANLVGNTLKMEYQDRTGGPWRNVPVDAQTLNGGGAMSGRMTWIAETRSPSIIVRAEVADRAGNRTAVSRRVALPPSARQQRTPLARSSFPGNDPYAGLGNADGSIAWPDGDALPMVGPTAPAVADAAPEPAHADAPGESLVAHRLPPTNAPAPSEASAVEPSSRDDIPKMTNSLRFQLEYVLDAVGPAGVDEVQLWGTRDSGQTWNKLAIDEDKQSPVAVTVEREGTYGFRVVIIGNNGLASPAPQPGDRPDVWVGVDMTSPTVRLTGARYGKAAHAGQLEIRWQADDEYLAADSISLEFSADAQGPWTTIEAGLPNTGRYYWRVDASVPQEVYLRIRVYDAAGNSAEHRLRSPVATAGLAPKAHIRGVRPAAETSGSRMLWNPYFR